VSLGISHDQPADALPALVARCHFTPSLFSPGQNDTIEHEHEGAGKEVDIAWFMYCLGIGAT